MYLLIPKSHPVRSVSKVIAQLLFRTLSTASTPFLRTITTFKNSIRFSFKQLQLKSMSRVMRKNILLVTISLQVDVNCCQDSRKFIVYIDKSQEFFILLSNKFWLNATTEKDCSSILKSLKH